MDAMDRALSYVFSLFVGAFLFSLILGLSGEDPKSQRAEGRSEGYEQGVKDCMTGRAKVEIKADTLVTFP